METTSDTNAVETKPAVAPDVGRPVVICTEDRGVFFGYLAPDYKPGQDPITIAKARMCVYWSQETKGVVGLASSGPGNGSRITGAGPSIELRKITAVMECSPEAVLQWERAPWA
jgi:hypothetical protein